MRLVRFVVIAGLLLSSLCGTSFSADVTGRAFMGSSVGTMLFISDDQMNGSKIWRGGVKLSSGVKPRPYGDVSFGYVFKPYLSGVVNVGFGWEGYTFDDLRVATAIPITVGVEYRYGTRKVVPRAGVGVGYYIWSVLEDRKVMQDPITREDLKRGDPGGYVKGGVDYFVRPDLSLTGDVAGHHVFSKDLKAFPSGYGYNEDILTMKIGLKYYFVSKKGY